ncbi:MAG: DUF4173 domain-containing protein [Actinomycetota bacterium]|nr:DUF4173 domain-containing protein [Actinomycetota bacterium]
MRTFSGVCLAAALLAAATLPGQHVGVNLAVVWIAIGAAVWIAAREGLASGDRMLFGAAFIPVLFFVVRAATWVVIIEILVALVALSVAVARARGWLGVVRAPLSVIRLARGFHTAVAPLLSRVAEWHPAVGPAARTGLLSAVLLGLFGTLFLTADAAFASIAETWFVPDVDLSLLPARIATGLLTLAVAGSLARLSPVLYDPASSPWTLAPSTSGVVRVVDWRVPLTLLNLLFAAFVGVQIAVLFGGHRHVLETTGLTYAQYARQGFFQLVIVAILTLGLIAIVVASSDRDRDKRALQILLGSLSLLTLVVLASAAWRMDLYQEAYGFTRMRLFVDLAIVFMGLVFLLLFIAGARWRAAWLPRAVVALALICGVGFAIYNPDLNIARRNVDRFQDTGNIDLAYLGGLSTDAIPALLELPEPQRSCAIGPIVENLRDATSVWAFNISRASASGIVVGSCPS